MEYSHQDESPRTLNVAAIKNRPLIPRAVLISEIRSFIHISFGVNYIVRRFISLYPYPMDYIVRLYIGLYRSNSCLAPAARGTHPRCRASGVLRLRR